MYPHLKILSLKRKYWEIFILILSLYVLIELSIEIIYTYDQLTINLINHIDLIICCIFMGDFFFFLLKSENKAHYLKYHWIDFVASIPFMTFLRTFRLVRVIRIVRLLRGIKGLINVFRILGPNRLHSILISCIIILVIVMGYCSIAFYSFEKEVNVNVHGFFDAFWWAFVSLTSIGYGDIIPTTTEGRIVGMVLSLAGMGLFSIITARLASAFLKIQKQEDANLQLKHEINNKPSIEKVELKKENQVCKNCGNDTFRVYNTIIVDDSRFYCSNCGEFHI